DQQVSHWMRPSRTGFSGFSVGYNVRRVMMGGPRRQTLPPFAKIVMKRPPPRLFMLCLFTLYLPSAVLAVEVSAKANRTETPRGHPVMITVEVRQSTDVPQVQAPSVDHCKISPLSGAVVRPSALAGAASPSPVGAAPSQGLGEGVFQAVEKMA